MPPPSTIFVIVVILLVCVGTLGMVLLKVASWLAYRRASVRPVVNRYAYPTAYDMSSAGVWEEDEEEDDSGVPAGSERTDDSSGTAFVPDGTARTPAFSSEPLDGFVLSVDELRAVQQMTHYLLTTAQRGQPPSKSGAILAGFGLKRGGGPRYIRASEVYDTLFGQPEPVVTPVANRRTRARFPSEAR